MKVSNQKNVFTFIIVALICIVSHRSLAQTSSTMQPALPSPEQKSLLTIPEAIILGLVEGITEYLPISSTGHLVLADEFLGFRDENNLTKDQLSAIQAYEIVIQFGAILAVVFLYASRIKEMLSGLIGRNPSGRRLAINVIVGFLPAGFAGVFVNKFVKSHLQFSVPVIFALAVGGLFMIYFERSQTAKKARRSGQSLENMTPKTALGIGLCQCLAMWPGTSRSMATILGGMYFGLNPAASAEFSFLLGLVTLTAASIFKIYSEGSLLITHIGLTNMTIGIAVAGVSAAFAIKAFVSYLNRRGLAPFGWYRIGLAALIFIILGSQKI